MRTITTFSVDGKIYERCRNMKTIKIGSNGTPICSCGLDISRQKIVMSPYRGMQYDKDFLNKMDSMEATIIECGCGQLYLKREGRDYDYFTYTPIKQTGLDNSQLNTNMPNPVIDNRVNAVEDFIKALHG